MRRDRPRRAGAQAFGRWRSLRETSKRRRFRSVRRGVRRALIACIWRAALPTCLRAMPKLGPIPAFHADVQEQVGAVGKLHVVSLNFSFQLGDRLPASRHAAYFHDCCRLRTGVHLRIYRAETETADDRGLFARWRRDRSVYAGVRRRSKACQ